MNISIGVLRLAALTAFLSFGFASAVQEESSTTEECGVYVGLSTLPGTGIGMFAGKDFQKGDELLSIGDHIIPIVDVGWEIENNDDRFFLWDEYTWNSNFFGAERMGLYETGIASPGFGAAANSFMDFVNVDEEEDGLYSVPDDIHRGRDPQAGAFTYRHSRVSKADKNIEAGQELFVAYGDHWFKDRAYNIGPIPVTGDHKKAENLYKSFEKKILKKFTKPGQQVAMNEFWDIFVGESSGNPWESRIIASLPPRERYTEMKDIGLLELKTRDMVRSMEWLQKHAVCVDNFYFGKSSIPKAGHGVFAKRGLKRGQAVLPVPVIHIPDRSILNLKSPKEIEEDRNINGGIRKQLLLNFCLGHANSTILLSPYGPVFNVINHNQTLANVRLQWALPERSNHHPELLEKNISHFFEERSSKLAMELIALRDIQPDEEIFLDYGDEWEAAWQDHLSNWKPEPDADQYISADEMNRNNPEELKTEFEQLIDPYPSNVAIVFDSTFQNRRWVSAFKRKKDISRFRKSGNNVPCEILDYKMVDSRRLYTIALLEEVEDDDDEEEERLVLVEEMPRAAFSFEDKPYTADMFLTNAFRHDIRIPDDIFPDAWKNIKPKAQN